MSRYAKIARTPVPQSEPENARQVQNNAGGFVYALDDWRRLERFLILGSDSNTYYQKARALTRENAACVTRCWASDPGRTATEIVQISHEGRAPKNDAAIFALALGAAHTDVKARQAALGALEAVCRTATHLFMFCDMARALGRGRGRAFNRAIKNWYLRKAADKLAYQMVKYRSRENYTHARLLKTARPKTDDPVLGALFRWGVDKTPLTHEQSELLPVLVRAHIGAMTAATPAEWARYVADYALPWEALPTAALNEPTVWEALLPGMGFTALVRNLSRLTQLELVRPLGGHTNTICTRLTNVEQIRKARMHPYNLLVAWKTYAFGKGFRGQSSWKPVPQVVDALEGAFYAGFGLWEPSGKRTLIGLDVSGSMSSGLSNGPLMVCEGAAAMCMTALRTEKQAHVMAFDEGFRDLSLTPRMSLFEVLQRTQDVNGGGTDCSLPMLWAAQNQVEVDVFAVYTDNETWAGNMHPMRALKDYRQKTGIPARLVVTGMTATNFTIADPDDPGSLDVVGFDTAAPAVIADFACG